MHLRNLPYTKNLENSIFNLKSEEDDEELFSKILLFLNDANSFRNFGEALKSIIWKYMPDSYDGSEKDFLKQSAVKEGIRFNNNTLNNWFSGTRPKKSDLSREHMYEIGFALRMSVEDVRELFRKAYFDRAFNMRDVHEFVYYYCFEHGYSKQHADKIIDAINLDNHAKKDLTIRTVQISEAVEGIKEDKKLIDYIYSHQHNFQINNRTAIQVRDALLNEIQAREGERVLINQGIMRLDNSAYSYIAREISYWTNHSDNEEGAHEYLSRYKSLTSIETMLDIIQLGMTRQGKAVDQSGKLLFKDSAFPQEIVSRFPIKQTFSKANPTFEEIRKMIILLFSYKFWFEKEYNFADTDLEDYTAQLNSLLTDCGLQTLYYGNPFDWLFLFCSSNEDPLEQFRSIILEGRTDL